MITSTTKKYECESSGCVVVEEVRVPTTTVNGEVTGGELEYVTLYSDRRADEKIRVDADEWRAFVATCARLSGDDPAFADQS